MPIGRNQIIGRLTSLNRGKRGGFSAPHKPLLVLLMLARYWRGESRMVLFCDIDPNLRAMVSRFSLRPATKQDALTPFWHMRGESDLWELRDYKHLQKLERKSSDDRPSHAEAVASMMTGGLLEHIYSSLARDRNLIVDAIFAVLEKYFPKHEHMEILSYVGFPDWDATYEDAPERVILRDKVLASYGHKCSVCSFGNAFYGSEVSVEAAQIQWASDGGPDAAGNLIALCSLHRGLFDGGAFTLSDKYQVRVSSRFKEIDGAERAKLLTKYHNKPVLLPRAKAMRPEPIRVKWHRDNIFR